jgi:hypothetical protein
MNATDGGKECLWGWNVIKSLDLYFKISRISAGFTFGACGLHKVLELCGMGIIVVGITSPTWNGQPDVKDFKVGCIGEKLSAPSEPG